MTVLSVDRAASRNAAPDLGSLVCDGAARTRGTPAEDRPANSWPLQPWLAGRLMAGSVSLAPEPA